MATETGGDVRGPRMRRLACRGMAVVGLGAGLWLAGQLSGTAAADEGPGADLLSDTVAEVSSGGTAPVLGTPPPIAELVPPPLRPVVTEVAVPVLREVPGAVVRLLDGAPLPPVVDAVVVPVVEAVEPVVEPVVDLVAGHPSPLPLLGEPALHGTPALPTPLPSPATAPLPGSDAATPADDVGASAGALLTAPADRAAASGTRSTGDASAPAATRAGAVPVDPAPAPAPRAPLPAAALPGPGAGSASGAAGTDQPSAAFPVAAPAPDAVARLVRGTADRIGTSASPADPATSPD